MAMFKSFLSGGEPNGYAGGAKHPQRDALNRPNFSGVWRHVRSDNFNEFLKESGVNWMMRKFAVKSDPIYTIFHEDDVIRVIFSNGGTSRETAFVIGEEYDEVDWQNVPMKVRVTWEGDAMVELHEPAEWGNGRPLRITKALQNDNEMLVFTLELGDVTARRYFKRQLEHEESTMTRDNF